jgi:serine/threonine-protein kinase
MVSTGLALIFGMAAGWPLLRSEPSEAVVRFALDVQPAIDHGVAISPDGSVVVVGEPHGPTGSPIRLWQRRLDRLGPVPIPDTEGREVYAPAISPDGAEVAFHVDGQVKVAPLGGGIVRTVAEGAACCPRWGPDDFIYYSTADDAVDRVPRQGGVAEAVTGLGEGDTGHFFFQTLPGGEFATMVVERVDGEQRIEALNLRTGERRVLTDGSSPRFAPTGHLLFSSVDGRLLGAPFDPSRADLTGPVTPLIEGLAVYNGDFVSYDLSQSGTLVYVTGNSGLGGAPLEFVWVTRAGQATPVDASHTFPNTGNQGWRLSPDETKVAFNYIADGNNDIRIKHLPFGPEERITFSEDDDFRPFWTPDGQSVTYFSGPSATDRNVWSSRADGTGEPVLVLDEERSFADGEWSDDGESLVLRRGATAAMGVGLRDILAFRPGVDSVAVPIVATPEFREGQPTLSPDGRWLAYSSNETGRDEVFVRPFPNVDSARVRVSTNGGAQPVWAKSGNELFFVDENLGLVAAQFDRPSGQVLEQETLFTIPADYDGYYDVSLDGERFLMVRPTGNDTQLELIVVQNFFEELKRLVPN